jgi:hypothetical protein
MHTTTGEHMKMPVAYLDVAARYVELAPHLIFRTPTVANLGSPVGLYLEQPWVGLTDEDCKGMSAGDRVVAMWADRILKEKNA